MGGLLSIATQIVPMVGKLLSGLGEYDNPPEHESHQDNICVCCSTLSVAEHVEHEKDSDQERDDD